MKFSSFSRMKVFHSLFIFCQGEFLCPVCRRLANSILPALPGESQKILKQSHDSSARLPHAPGPSYKSSEEINLLHLHQGLALLQSAANAASSVESLNKCFPHQNYLRIIGPNLQPVSRVLSKMYFSSRQDKFLRSSRVSPPLLMWDVLKYSLQSMEIAARCGRTYTTPTYCLDALYKELESSSGFMLSLLLKVVQSTRRENSVLVLQRFGGIQSFAYSICPAGSVDHNGNACGPGTVFSRMTLTI